MLSYLGVVNDRLNLLPVPGERGGGQDDSNALEADDGKGDQVLPWSASIKGRSSETMVMIPGGCRM